MFYHAFLGVPEWSPAGENHILYLESVLKNVFYSKTKVQYTTTTSEGIEFLRLAFKPAEVTVNGLKLSLRSNLSKEGYTLKELGNGDYALNIKRMQTGNVIMKDF